MEIAPIVGVSLVIVIPVISALRRDTQGLRALGRAGARAIAVTAAHWR